MMRFRDRAVDGGFVQQHGGRRIPERNEAVHAGYPGDRAAKAGLDQSGDDAFADTPRMPGLVGHQNPPGGRRLAHDVVDRQGREEPQVHDPSRDAVLRQAPGHSQAHAQPVAKGEDGEIHAIAINAGGPDRDVRVRIVGWWVFAQPAAVARAVQVALVV